MRCTACNAEITEPGRFCPQCATPLAPTGADAETIALTRRPSLSSSTSSEDGRFPPGTLLADRYRVNGLIGRGGMGEVYRASDLKLNQPVALKFLPEAVAAKPGRLERFHSEVRIARQVSHPNVCRVYDIGEAEGATFISMEYVDGEDLGCLLRRIGRLPYDKALEIARKLCAGLAAAHAKGVLHRDLKPANIMIDGRGQVLIMDFGLAALADQVLAADVRSGTPAYMAPEQLAGKEVSERSDLYALGLVLYEIFTGQRAFKTADRSSIPSVSSVVQDVDPAIERVIARCLEPDPGSRPRSALALARMLPGGDPLAEALAAGETPTPELVANSGSTEGLRVPVAVACLLVVVLGIGVRCWIAQSVEAINRTPLDYSSEVLSAKAREIASEFGYTQRPVDRVFGWFVDVGYAEYAASQPDSARRMAQLGTNRPPILYFWYREAPRHLLPASGGPVTVRNPPATERGNLQMLLDSEGRLLQFRAYPDEKQPSAQPAFVPGFEKALAAAGLDRSRLTESQPSWVPPSAFDARAAWTAAEGADSLRVEAAAWQGRLVALERQLPWTPKEAGLDASVSGLFALFLPLAAAAVAWRNLRLGRGDRRGANRVAMFLFACMLTTRLCISHHLSSGLEVWVWVTALRDSLFIPVTTWLIYVAFEPYLRRYVPKVLIGWSRLLEGRWRDPLVGGHLLTGVVTGIAVCLILAPIPPGGTTAKPIDSIESFGWLAEKVVGGVNNTLLFTLLWLLLRIPARRNWLASVLAVAATAAVYLPSVGLAGVFPAVLFIGAATVIIVRFGILASVSYMFTHLCLIGQGAAAWTTSLSAWYARTSLLAIAAILAIAIYGFRTTLAGRPLWRDELQKDAA